MGSFFNKTLSIISTISIALIVLSIIAIFYCNNKYPTQKFIQICSFFCSYILSAILFSFLLYYTRDQNEKNEKYKYIFRFSILAMITTLVLYVVFLNDCNNKHSFYETFIGTSDVILTVIFLKSCFFSTSIFNGYTSIEIV